MNAPHEFKTPLLPANVVPGRQDSLVGSRRGLLGLAPLLDRAARAAHAAPTPSGPMPPGSSACVLEDALGVLGPAVLPDDGIGDDAALASVARLMTQFGLDLAHPHAAAHLQPAPLRVAVVADALASASNASLDTYDSGPSAIAMERWLIRALTRFVRLGPNADGVLTPGGSLSNLLGLLLARDAAALARGVDARREGVTRISRPVVFCSELAHFSTHRACAALGLGENAVHSIPTDARRRLRTRALEHALRELSSEDTPVAIVATAGTTDFGSIDPLPALAEIAAEHELWLHVDAAYGFGALFSEHLCGRLDGLQRADSITLDLHKLGWQPAAASVLLVADTASFAALDREVAYLNPGDDTAAGLDGLLGRSLQTTRRPDAMKIVASLLALGRRGLGALVDHCHDLASHAERRIIREPCLELVAPAELTTVVFRYRSQRPLPPMLEDEVNAALRRLLLDRGVAVIGRTSTRAPAAGAAPRVCLKLTLLNPGASREDIDAVLTTIALAGAEVERFITEQVA